SNRGTSGGGATMSFTSGASATTGAMQITGAVAADAVGSGTAGNLTFSFKDAGNTMTIGAATAPDFISGTVTAASPTGTAGNISFSNTANSGLTINNTGTLSAIGNSGANYGTISFNPGITNQAISVTGVGLLSGKVNASGTSVTVSTSAAASVVTVGPTG